jgi:hypothetical protein
VKQILKNIKTLAKDECANYMRGNCLLTDKRCHLINPNYESIYDGAIDCDYFLECVLPIDPELNRIVWGELLREEDMIRPDDRTCVCCGAAFVPGSSRQQYCPHCKPRHEQLRNRDKQRSYNQRKQANNT